ncbi:MAG TPA: response regulator [Candidatus Angelobacter sp.]|jgi:FixJ family two-component response regulator|nr:response regulator [Candidatus Angelobacter sp.]
MTSKKPTASFLKKKPDPVSLAALALTASVIATGSVFLVFTGKQFLHILVSAVILAPFVGAALGAVFNAVSKSVARTSAAGAVAPSRNQTVLLLQADTSLREIIEEGLTQAGFYMVSALSAKHAATICRQHGGLVDLLLANINALGSRPLDCLQSIKTTQPDLPVLLISAHDRHTLCQQHAELLATYEFLPVPFEFPHLTETIDTLLQLATSPTEQSQTRRAQIAALHGLSPGEQS